MAEQAIQAYRNYVKVDLVTPVIVAEGSPGVDVLELNVTAIPNGRYKYYADAIWDQAVGKYMLFKINANGVDGPQVGAVHDCPEGIHQLVTGAGEVLVTGNVLVMRGNVEFPDQQGTAMGTVHGASIVIERKLES